MNFYDKKKKNIGQKGKREAMSTEKCSKAFL